MSHEIVKKTKDEPNPEMLLALCTTGAFFFIVGVFFGFGIKEIQQSEREANHKAKQASEMPFTLPKGTRIVWEAKLIDDKEPTR